MPALKIKHVVSFSSEDKFNPAENIIKQETYYKWRCANGSEKHATIVLQLEKASQICGLDIGNNGSAFIEVLVGSSAWSSDEEFKVLLAASSFMTPSQSKTGKDINRVRMFGMEALNKVVAAQKWDLVKIVCSQPYSQDEPYGLSFFKLHSPEESCENSKRKIIKLGCFNLKDESDEENKSSMCGSFFQKRMNIPVAPVAAPKTAMAALARSNSPSFRGAAIFKTIEDKSSGSKVASISDDRRKDVASALLKGNDLYTKECTFPKAKVAEIIKKKKILPKQVTDKPRDNNANEKSPEYKARNTLDILNSPPSKKAKVTMPKLKRQDVAFNKIMSGVVIVLSGYQNPERSNIRDEALSMGAKYEQSWSSRCTHLICAFANTPKFKEVIGKGKIVTKKWIIDCHRYKRKLNTKNYRLDGGGDSTFESSTSEDESTMSSDKIASITGRPNKDEQINDQKSSSECDTEDEIEKIRMLEKENLDSETISSNKVKYSSEEDLYDASTDEGDASELNVSNNLHVNQKDNFNIVANFFEGKTFLLYGDFDMKDRGKLKRYINLYSGHVEEYMKDAVNYVISQESWDNNFKLALDGNPSLIFIKPKWIFKCHEKQKLVPYESYQIKQM